MKCTANSLLSKLKGHIRVVIRRGAASIFYCVHGHKHVRRRVCIYDMWIRGYIHACKADTNRRFLSHTAQESIMYIFHIKFSPPVFTTLMFAVVFSVHNSSSGVKLMLPHQEERTNNKPNSFSSSSHPVYDRILSCFTLFPRSLVSFFLSSALSCALRLEVLSVSSS